jgi:hypothetical protein
MVSPYLSVILRLDDLERDKSKRTKIAEIALERVLELRTAKLKHPSPR